MIPCGREGGVRNDAPSTYRNLSQLVSNQVRWRGKVWKGRSKMTGKHRMSVRMRTHADTITYTRSHADTHTHTHAHTCIRKTYRFACRRFVVADASPSARWWLPFVWQQRLLSLLDLWHQRRNKEKTRGGGNGLRITTSCRLCLPQLRRMY